MSYDNTERRDNEVFLGNTDVTKGIALPAHLRHLKTIRLGAVATDYQGKPLPADYMRPMFIARTEEPEYDRIMMRRLSNTRRGIAND